jgi:hypothetical protein
MTNSWQILISDTLGGLAPRYYNSGYASYGNSNQSSQMLNMDLTDPNGMTQGSGLSTLTNGTQSVVTSVLNSILKHAVTSDFTYGIGGNKLHKISSTAVSNAGIWPHTFSSLGSEVGEDVCYYQSKLYYSFNEAGGADIGMYDLVTTFDDNWGSTVPTGHALLTAGVPHQMMVSWSDVMYFTNGRYIGSWNGTTFAPQQLTLPLNTVAVSIVGNSGQIYIGANMPNVTGNNKNRACIYIWDGTTATWTTEIPVMGKIGGFHVKNGVPFFFYQDVSNIGGYKLAYLNGIQVVDIANYSGGLPSYSEVCDFKDFIIWNAASLNSLWSYTTFPWQLNSPWTTSTGDDLIYAYGSGDVSLPARMFQIADSGYTTAGGLAAPFGNVMISSTDGSNIKLAQFSGYDTNSYWKSLIFDMVNEGKITKLNQIKITFEQLTTGARVDWKIRDNCGTIIYQDSISYSKLGAVSRQEVYTNGLVVNNFRIEFDYSNGSTTNSVKIKNVKFYGISQ